MLIRRQVNERVCGFSSNYFMYSEDMDLCIKVAKAGWKIYYVPNARIVHHAEGSSRSREESNFSTIMVRESLTQFMQVHHGRSYAVLYRCTTALVALLRLLLLVLALPIAVHPVGCRLILRASKKWCGVLAWSAGIKSWVSRQPHGQALKQPPVASAYDTQEASVQRV